MNDGTGSVPQQQSLQRYVEVLTSPSTQTASITLWFQWLLLHEHAADSRSSESLLFELAAPFCDTGSPFSRVLPGLLPCRTATPPAMAVIYRRLFAGGGEASLLRLTLVPPEQVFSEIPAPCSSSHMIRCFQAHPTQPSEANWGSRAHTQSMRQCRLMQECKCACMAYKGVHIAALLSLIHI